MCRLNERLTHLESMAPVVILGGDAGGVYLVNLESADLVASPKMEDHDGPVTGLSAHMTLSHFISCSTDGMIKVEHSECQRLVFLPTGCPCQGPVGAGPGGCS